MDKLNHSSIRHKNRGSIWCETRGSISPETRGSMSRPEKTLQVLEISPVFSCHF